MALLVLSCVSRLQGQVRVESLTVADGLSQGFVTSVIQDAQGFIWMGTFDGLNRYDGFNIRHYKPKPFDSLSIQASYITSLYEDVQRFIWVGTTEGLYLLEPLRENFYYLSGPETVITARHVKQITGDKWGNVFVQLGSDNEQVEVFSLTIPDDFAKKIALRANPLSYLKMRRVPLSAGQQGICMIECIGDTLLLATNGRETFFRFDVAGNRFERFDLQGMTQRGAIDDDILWGKNKSYIFRQQMPDGSKFILPVEKWTRAFRGTDGRLSALYYPGGPLLVAKSNAPVCENPGMPKESLIRLGYFQNAFPADQQHTFSAWNENILADRSGVLWVSTAGWGIKKINPRQIVFGKYFSGKSISSLRELPDGRIWIRKYNDSCIVLNPLTDKLEAAPWGQAFGNRPLYEICVTKENNYWSVSCADNTDRLAYLDTKTKQVRMFKDSLPFVRGVPEKIFEDQWGNVWIAAHMGHLFRYRPGEEKLDHFSYSELLPEDRRTNIRATAIRQDAYGNIWVGTNLGVLLVRNAHQLKPDFKMLRHDVKRPGSISLDWINCLCPDPKDPDVMWLGTRGGGINRMQISSLTCSFWTEAPNGLPDNVVYGILPDNEGNLWCSTNRGICRVTPSLLQNTFISYQEAEGLSSTEFNTNSYLRSSDGRFWFGGVGGLNVFRPEELRSDNTAPPLVITAIKVRGVEYFPDKEGFLSLSSSENNVLFEFAALDYSNPATNRFRHRLQGIENEWVDDGAAHSANYSALPPGRYVFEVQGATADSPWSEETLQFTLVIGTPWYKHWLAYCSYLALAAGAMIGYIRYRDLKNKARLNQRESERLKQFEAVKNQFFANIAHELRTPLTVIMGLADRIERGVKGDSLTDNARQITRQSDQLLQLANQVLDLARLESEQFQLQMHKGNFIEFVRNHSAALMPLATSKGIRLEVTSEVPELWIDFDQQQLQKILNNLISNAIRHTAPGGKISVHTRLEEEGKWLNMSVSDTGEGITPEDLPRVFDRFFQSSRFNSEVGASGIGLTLTRDLVQLMGGRATVESTRGEGSVFSIILPVTRLTAPAATISSPVTETPATPVIIQHEQKPLLLLIEDNEDILAYLQLCLKSHFELAIATNGQAGIDSAFELIPDIILTDVAMPLKNGYEVTSTLKNDERTSHIPIAILTAKVEAGDRMTGYRRGANAYLTKPFNEAELLLVLQNLLHLQQQWKNRYAHFAGNTQTLPEIEQHAADVRFEDHFMQKLNGIFEEHFADDNFNLDTLCRILGMSSSQLDRKLKALSDNSPMTMLRTFRLQKAQEILRTVPHISIKEVCFRTGFKSPSHFSRLYSKEFGVPPSEG